ncbi:MAG: glycosyltransferase family 2 protein [Methylocystaceae bacterium]|nr:glycosyltransferase family 2 protein [Methylocystaceae bacterium]
MTSFYSIPIEFNQDVAHLRIDHDDDNSLTFVIPVFNDNEGLERTLKSMLQHLKCPQIIVVNDGSEYTETIKIVKICSQYPDNIELLNLSENKGAAAARNYGASRVKTKWIGFIDCDCELDARYERQLLLSLMFAGSQIVAVAGQVKSLGRGLIPEYMEEQGILNPPFNYKKEPQSIITANSIIRKCSFNEVGGFDESFSGAGGEDIDLGIRLKSVGEIAYSEKLILRHFFPNCENDFRERFVRYGKAAKKLEKKWQVNWEPKPFDVKHEHLRNLAKEQYLAMKKGYDSIE